MSSEEDNTNYDREAWDHALMVRPVEYLDDFEKAGSVARWFPELQEIVGFGGGTSGHKDLWLHTRQVVDQCVHRIEVRWAALFHDVGKPAMFKIQDKKTQKAAVTFYGHEFESYHLFRKAARRTKWFTPEEAARIEFLVKHLGHIEEYDSDWTDSAVRRLVNLGPQYFEDLVALASADITTKHEYKRKAHAARMQELIDRAAAIVEADARVPALVKGLGIELTKAFGIPPSKALGDLMKELTEAVEAGKLPRQADTGTIIAWVKDPANCLHVIPNTFIVCGEGKNYCSSVCLARAGVSKPNESP